MAKESVFFIDADVLTFLGQLGVNTGQGTFFLDQLFKPGRTVIVTSTVRSEAAGLPLSFPKDALVDSWINSGLSTGNIQVVSTSIPPGNDGGEQSILQAATGTNFFDKNIYISSNDSFFDTQGLPGNIIKAARRA